MNKQEVERLLTVIKARYGPKFRYNDITTTSWLMVLDDVSYEDAMQVLPGWMKQEEWAPDPAQIRKSVLDATSALPTAHQAWEIVIRRIKDTYPGQQMPDWDAQPEIQKAVRAIGGLREIRLSEKPDEMRRRFEKSYTEIRHQRSTTPALGPNTMKELLA